MKIQHRSSRFARLLVALLAIAFALAPLAATAAKKKDNKRRSKNQIMGKFAAERLTKANEAFSNGKHAEAQKYVDEVKKRSRLSAYEKAKAYQLSGFIAADQDKFKTATKEFEVALSDPEALPPNEVEQLYFNLGQLYMVDGNYDKGLETLLKYFDMKEDPGAVEHYMIAVAYVQKEQLSKAKPYAKKAVALSEVPKERWLQLLLAIHFDEKDYKSCAKLLEVLVVRFPNKNYWMQLFAAYSEIGLDKRALAVLELAYQQKLLNRGSEYRNLAQLYLHHDVPYKGAKIMQEALDKKLVEGDADDWELLANALIYAREHKKAVEPLEKAANLSSDGDLFVKLAQVHLENESWADADTTLGKALEKGGLKNQGNVYILRGVVNYNQKKLNSARNYFQQAAKYDKVAKSAKQWLKHVDRERTLQQSLLPAQDAPPAAEPDAEVAPEQQAKSPEPESEKL